ncbi:unnamed protein product [Amoebophrya sp. A25]|nr:unnamed protein product [Amoebophrya sp. A25]|eukprot:GSA25T00015699001.1
MTSDVMEKRGDSKASADGTVSFTQDKKGGSKDIVELEVQVTIRSADGSTTSFKPEHTTVVNDQAQQVAGRGGNDGGAGAVAPDAPASSTNSPRTIGVKVGEPSASTSTGGVELEELQRQLAQTKESLKEAQEALQETQKLLAEEQAHTEKVEAALVQMAGNMQELQKIHETASAAHKAEIERLRSELETARAC